MKTERQRAARKTGPFMLPITSITIRTLHSGDRPDPNRPARTPDRLVTISLPFIRTGAAPDSHPTREIRIVRSDRANQEQSK